MWHTREEEAMIRSQSIRLKLKAGESAAFGIMVTRPE